MLPKKVSQTFLCTHCIMVVSKLLSCFRLLLSPHYKFHFKKFWKSDRTPNEPLYTHILYKIFTFRKFSHFIEKSVPPKLRNSVQSKLRAQFFYSESFIAYSNNIWNFICPLPYESQENSNYNYTKLTFKLCTVLWRGR